MKNAIITCLVLALFALVACSSDTSVDAERLTALEAEVKTLQQEAQVREKIFREELAIIRMNLEGIQDVLKVEKGRADLMDQPSAEDESDAQKRDLDAKAKSFVSENLDRLLAITKKLLDKMESELDEQMKKNESPVPSESPEGDQI